MAAEHLLHMQKAAGSDYFQIHRVLNDITGMSGLGTLRARSSDLQLGSAMTAVKSTAFWTRPFRLWTKRFAC
jgi:hypothetical protein